MDDFFDTDFENESMSESDSSMGNEFDIEDSNTFDTLNEFGDDLHLFEQETNEHEIEETNGEQISFTGKYTDTEINKMKEEVSNLEYKLSYAKQNVHHWQNCYNLSHSSGDLSKLNSATSEMSNIVSNLSAAKSRLNNAI